MALATQCPFCQTTFRVANDQLKLRDGLVRCGHCHAVFDGNAHLLADQPDAGGNSDARGGNGNGNWPASSAGASPSAISSAVNPPLITPAMARATAAAPHYGEPPVTTLPDADTLAEIEAAWDLPPPSAEDGFAAPADQVLADADADTEADVKSDALMIEEEDAPAPRSRVWRTAAELHDDGDIDFSTPSLLLQRSTPPRDDGQRTEWRRTDGNRDEFSNDPDFERFGDQGAKSDQIHRGKEDGRGDQRDEDDERDERDERDENELLDQPEFILTAQRRQRRTRVRRVLMIVFSVILVFTGLAQAMYLERNRIALAAPQLKPLLVAACRPLRCTVGLQRQIDQLSIESNELQVAKPDQPALILNLLLRNRADVALAWPDIELTLNNDDEQAVIRRVFSPAEYLPAGQTAEAGFAGNTEQAVKLSFTLTQGTASGYRVYLFYP